MLTRAERKSNSNYVKMKFDRRHSACHVAHYTSSRWKCVVITALYGCVVSCLLPVCLRERADWKKKLWARATRGRIEKVWLPEGEYGVLAYMLLKRWDGRDVVTDGNKWCDFCTVLLCSVRLRSWAPHTQPRPVPMCVAHICHQPYSGDIYQQGVRVSRLMVGVGVTPLQGRS